MENELLAVIGSRDSNDNWSNLSISIVKPSGRMDSWSINANEGRRSRSSDSFNTPTLYSPKSTVLPESSSLSEMDPSSASSDWRAYSAFSLVVLTSEEWHSMPAGARSAIADWTRMGGRLQFADEMPNDAPATDVPKKPERGLGGVYESHGVRTVKSMDGAIAATKSKSPTLYAIGTGKEMLKSWLSSINTELTEDHFTSLPIIIVLGGFFLMMTPVNLLFLAPSSKRHRLFRTIPIISLSACLLLALAVLLGDGIGGKGERLVLIESRPGTENKQYITQLQASHSGALMNTSFSVKDSAYIAPMSDPGESLALRVEGDQLMAGGGWFTSRASQSHYLQTIRPSRGRIEWSNHSPNGHSVVSTYDFPLKNLYLLHHDGTWWHADVLHQGEITELKKVESTTVNEALSNSLINIPFQSKIEKMAHRAGHYIAFTDTPPAIETLSSIHWHDTGIVTGVMANP